MSQRKEFLRIIREHIRMEDEEDKMPDDATHYSFTNTAIKWFKLDDGKWWFWRIYWIKQRGMGYEKLSKEMVNLEEIEFHKHVKCDKQDDNVEN